MAPPARRRSIYDHRWVARQETKGAAPSYLKARIPYATIAGILVAAQIVNVLMVFLPQGQSHFPTYAVTSVLHVLITLLARGTIVVGYAMRERPGGVTTSLKTVLALIFPYLGTVLLNCMYWLSGSPRWLFARWGTLDFAQEVDSGREPPKTIIDVAETWTKAVQSLVE